MYKNHMGVILLSNFINAVDGIFGVSKEAREELKNIGAESVQLESECNMGFVAGQALLHE